MYNVIEYLCQQMEWNGITELNVNTYYLEIKELHKRGKDNRGGGEGGGGGKKN